MKRATPWPEVQAKVTPATMARDLLKALADPFERFGLRRALLERVAAGGPCSPGRVDDMRKALLDLDPKERKKLRIEELEERTKEVHRARRDAGELGEDPRVDVA